MTDQKRDESRDYAVCVAAKCAAPWSECDQFAKAELDHVVRYVPHSDLVAAEERSDDAETELTALKASVRSSIGRLESALYPDEDREGRQQLGFAMRTARAVLMELQEALE
jgi:hypothetical protein